MWGQPRYGWRGEGVTNAEWIGGLDIIRTRTSTWGLYSRDYKTRHKAGSTWRK